MNSLLLMNAQVPADTVNPFLRLFTPERAVKTIDALDNVQMSFDYSIARTNPPAKQVETGVKILQDIVK